jgi:hypothetical protein
VPPARVLLVPEAAAPGFFLYARCEIRRHCAPGTHGGDIRARLSAVAKVSHDPWLVRELQGLVHFRRADAGRLRGIPLDHNGYPTRAAGTAAEIRLRPDVLYYLISV